jgi:hypothetical protein
MVSVSRPGAWILREKAMLGRVTPALPHGGSGAAPAAEMGSAVALGVHLRSGLKTRNLTLAGAWGPSYAS